MSLKKETIDLVHKTINGKKKLQMRTCMLHCSHQEKVYSPRLKDQF